MAVDLVSYFNKQPMLPFTGTTMTTEMARKFRIVREREGEVDKWHVHCSATEPGSPYRELIRLGRRDDDDRDGFDVLIVWPTDDPPDSGAIVRAEDIHQHVRWEVTSEICGWGEDSRKLPEDHYWDGQWEVFLNRHQEHRGLVTLLFAVQRAIAFCVDTRHGGLPQELYPPENFHKERDFIHGAEVCCRLYAALWIWRRALVRWINLCASYPNATSDLLRQAAAGDFLVRMQSQWPVDIGNTLQGVDCGVHLMKLLSSQDAKKRIPVPYPQYPFLDDSKPGVLTIYWSDMQVPTRMLWEEDPQEYQEDFYEEDDPAR